MTMNNDYCHTTSRILRFTCLPFNLSVPRDSDSEGLVERLHCVFADHDLAGLGEAFEAWRLC